MFRKTATKLTILYLAIMMAVSLFFSVNLYQLSVQEFDRGFRRQANILQRDGDFGLPPFARDQIMQEQQERYMEAKSRVLSRLILINLIILIGGGFLSYYLARRTIKPIEEAHQALERFTADASHELRTPITAMQTETEVALMNPKLTLAESKQQLRSNLEELAKLTALSDGLLRLARLENNTLAFKDLSLQQIIQKAMARVAPTAKKKAISIINKADLKVKVAGDEEGLTEVLVIILDNAIKYSGEKTEVTIQTKQEAGSTLLSISDQGIGIKASQLPHIFERFYRADAARNKQIAEGHGLGLAIAQNIIELHNGKITVTSKPGQGSRFTIHLPPKA